MTARVALTFDDGPDPVWTLRVAAELERAEVRGTFFVVGERVAGHPEIATALVAAGHQVELHCMRHVRHIDCDAREIRRDTDEALALWASLGLRRPRWWRPPGGVLAPWTEAIAREAQLRIAKWSVDPRDWEGGSPGELVARVEASLTPGGIVVLHDAPGFAAPRGDSVNTVMAIGPLVASIRGRGWNVAKLDQTVPRYSRRRVVDGKPRPRSVIRQTCRRRNSWSG